jgi:hypothetical protein
MNGRLPDLLYGASLRLGSAPWRLRLTGLPRWLSRTTGSSPYWSPRKAQSPEKAAGHPSQQSPDVAEVRRECLVAGSATVGSRDWLATVASLRGYSLLVGIGTLVMRPEPETGRGWRANLGGENRARTDGRPTMEIAGRLPLASSPAARSGSRRREEPATPCANQQVVGFNRNG